VLNALSIDPGRQWKGVWRWFSESQLQVRAPPPRHVLSRDVWQCCVDNDTVLRLGVTFDQFVCLGRCNGAVVDAHRASHVTLEQFRGTVAAVCSQQPMEKTAFLVSRFLILLQSCNAFVPALSPPSSALPCPHTAAVDCSHAAAAATAARHSARQETGTGRPSAAIMLGWTWCSLCMQLYSFCNVFPGLAARCGAVQVPPALGSAPAAPRVHASNRRSHRPLPRVRTHVPV
jgi:hypothetical protein